MSVGPSVNYGCATDLTLVGNRIYKAPIIGLSADLCIQVKPPGGLPYITPARKVDTCEVGPNGNTLGVWYQPDTTCSKEINVGWSNIVDLGCQPKDSPNEGKRVYESQIIPNLGPTSGLIACHKTQLAVTKTITRVPDACYVSKKADQNVLGNWYVGDLTCPKETVVGWSNIVDLGCQPKDSTHKGTRAYTSQIIPNLGPQAGLIACQKTPLSITNTTLRVPDSCEVSKSADQKVNGTWYINDATCPITNDVPKTDCTDPKYKTNYKTCPKQFIRDKLIRFGVPIGIGLAVLIILIRLFKK